jgi:anaerobic ribonucleoside-triphosphate reductase activating protein
VRLSGSVVRTRVLGPGTRAAFFWVQGCPFRCPGCISPDTHAFDGGTPSTVAGLVERLLAFDDVEGLTISGGEPFSQAEPLADLVLALKRRTSWSFMCYTGHRLPDIIERGRPNELRLLRTLDILIDGLYVEDLHTAKRWRGSVNQTVHFLSPRYRHLSPLLHEEGVWIETHIDNDRGVQFVGIPPRRFFTALTRAFEERGVRLEGLRG